MTANPTASTTRRSCSRPSARRCSRWPRSTSGCSARRGVPGDRADLRLRRRPRRHRAGRPPRRVQPDVPRVRAAGRLVRGGVRGQAPDRGWQGADGQPAHARTFVRAPRAAGGSRRPGRRARQVAQAQDRDLHGDGRGRHAPDRGRASAGSSPRRMDAGWTLAVASTSAEASVRAILEQAAGPERAARFDVVLAGDVVEHKKPAPDIYLLALERLGVPAAETLVDRGLAQRPARRDGGRAALRHDRQRLHRRGGQ